MTIFLNYLIMLLVGLACIYAASCTVCILFVLTINFAPFKKRLLEALMVPIELFKYLKYKQIFLISTYAFYTIFIFSPPAIINIVIAVLLIVVVAPLFEKVFHTKNRKTEGYFTILNILAICMVVSTIALSSTVEILKTEDEKKYTEIVKIFTE